MRLGEVLRERLGAVLVGDRVARIARGPVAAEPKIASIAFSSPALAAFSSASTAASGDAKLCAGIAAGFAATSNASDTAQGEESPIDSRFRT